MATLEEGRDCLSTDRAGLLQGAEQVGKYDHQPQADHQTGNQALEASPVEPAEVDPPGVVHFAHEQQRDKEAGEDEEDVHTEQSVGEHVRVVEQDGTDSRTAQAVDGGEVRTVGPDGPDRYRGGRVVGDIRTAFHRTATPHLASRTVRTPVTRQRNMI